MPEHGELAQWLTGNKKFQKYWQDTMKELVDRFHPALLYSDSGLPFEEEGYQPGLDAVSYLYNDSIERNGQNQAVYTQKNRNQEIYRVGVLDIEKSQLPGVNPSPWQTDTCIGNWFYDAKQTFKHPEQIIEMLVDIISKNGCMLLNVLQRPDGTIDAETRFILEELAKWFAVCQEGVEGQGLSGYSEKAIQGCLLRASGKTRRNGTVRISGLPGKVIRFTLYAESAGKQGGGHQVAEAGGKVRSVRLLGAGNGNSLSIAES